MAARVQDGKLEDGLGVLAVEASASASSASAATELDRAKQWMAAFYERAYNERDKTESGSFAQEYVSYFLERRAEPRHRLRIPARPAAAADHHRADDVSTMARSLLGDDSRVILATSPQKAGIKIPTEAELQAAIATATAARVTPWNDTGADARADGARAGRRRASPRAARCDELGVTVVRSPTASRPG